jgi:hypothetical protein
MEPEDLDLIACRTLAGDGQELIGRREGHSEAGEAAAHLLMRDQVSIGDLAGVVGSAELLELLAETGVLGQDARRLVLDRISLGLGRHRAHRTVRPDPRVTAP